MYILFTQPHSLNMNPKGRIEQLKHMGENNGISAYFTNMGGFDTSKETVLRAYLNGSHPAASQNRLQSTFWDSA